MREIEQRTRDFDADGIMTIEIERLVKNFNLPEVTLQLTETGARYF